MSKLKAALRGLALGLVAVPLLAAAASASIPPPEGGGSSEVTTHITGDCFHTTVIAGTVTRTAHGGDVFLKYTNGVGLFNGVSVNITMVDTSGNPISQSTTMGGGTGHTYDLGYAVAGTKFRLNFRCNSTPTVDSHWEGDLTY